ncbi:MAG: hypothetical protein H6918_05940 [Sphingomonadaceae bacterium]|nr:hypothetical protein [Sphingomonadaceae bacterium]
MSNNPTPEELAKARFFTLGLVRLAGVAIVVLGMLVLQGTLDWPDPAGWVLLAVGLVDFFAMPLVLARRWRTPD